MFGFSFFDPTSDRRSRVQLNAQGVLGAFQYLLDIHLHHVKVVHIGAVVKPVSRLDEVKNFDFELPILTG